MPYELGGWLTIRRNGLSCALLYLDKVKKKHRHSVFKHLNFALENKTYKRKTNFFTHKGKVYSCDKLDEGDEKLLGLSVEEVESYYDFIRKQNRRSHDYWNR